MGSPRARLQRRHEVPTGYPTTGLVAYFDLMVDNLLLKSEAFDTWSKHGGGVAAPVVTADAVANPRDGAQTADQVDFPAVGDANIAIVYQVGVPSSAISYANGLWLRTVTGTASIWLMETPDGASFTSTRHELTTEWQLCSHVATGFVGAALQFGRDSRDVNQQIGSVGAFSVYAWGAQRNPGTSLRDYVATTDLQSLSSLYGKSPTLQRGATSGAEASDGSYGASGWVAVTDDYGVTPTLAGIGPGDSFTLVLVGKLNGAAGFVAGLVNDAIPDGSQYVGMQFISAGNLRGISRNGGTTLTSDAIAVSATDHQCVVLTSDGTNLTITRWDTGATASAASANPSGTSSILGIAALPTAPASSICDAMTVSLATFHNAALSTAQIQRAYRALKAQAARKGVVVL